jgi:hypothetical protein
MGTPNREPAEVSMTARVLAVILIFMLVALVIAADLSGG